MKRIALLLAVTLFLQGAVPVNAQSIERIEEPVKETQEKVQDIDKIDTGEAIFVEPERHTGGLIIQNTLPSDVHADSVYSGWGTREMLAAADTEAQRVVKELTNDSMTDIEKIFVLAQYMNENVEYGVDSNYAKYNGQTAYEALIVKKSVCAGNAAAYNMLTYYAGINSIYLTSHQACHAWVEVELDGNWYYVDAQNCNANQTFLMAKNSEPYYDRPDIDTYESFEHNPYDYLHSPQPATDHTFDKINYLTMKVLRVEGSVTYYTYAMDFDTFDANLAKAGINKEYYRSTGLYNIEVNYNGGELINGEKLKKSDFSVVPIYRKQNPNGTYVDTKGEKAATSAFTITPEIVKSGVNEINVTYTEGEISKSSIVNITAKEDVLLSRTLKNINVSCSASEIMKDNNLKDYLTVIPVVTEKYKSGVTIDTELSAVTDYIIETPLKKGINNVKINYTLDGVTKTATVTVNVLTPYPTKVTLLKPDIELENGSIVSLVSKAAAQITTSDDKVILADVEWEPYQNKYDCNETDKQVFDVEGIVILPEDMDNVKNIPLNVTTHVTILEATKVVTLTASKEAGTYSQSFSLKLSTDVATDIYYSLDGSAYTKYLGAINIMGNQEMKVTHTLKAYARKKGYKEGTLDVTYVIRVLGEDKGLSKLCEEKYIVKGGKFDILPSYEKYKDAKLRKADGITFETDDKKVATVSNKGLVTGKNAGATYVYIKKNGEDIGKYKVTVEIPAFKEKTYALIKGDSMNVAIGGTVQEAVYSIPDKSRAYVDYSNDVLTGIKKGSVKITAVVGGKKYTTTVKIEEPKISKSSLVLKEGKKSTLKVTGTTRKDIQWKTTNKRVVVVDNGKLEAVSSGIAIVTAVIGTHEYNCEVIVK